MFPVLTIAGSDPSGGAGIQADLKTFTALKAYGMSVITALTVQNTTGVTGVHEIPADFVASQLVSVVEDIAPLALKTGMLSNSDVISSIASTLRSSFPSTCLPPLVIDPVTVSTSGHTLLPASAITALKSELIPLGCVLTPNVLEAEMLLAEEGSYEQEAEQLAKGKRTIDNLGKVFVAAKRLAELGSPNVLLKGGHLVLSMGDVQSQLGQFSDAEIHWPADEGIAILSPTLTAAQRAEQKVVVDVLYEGATAKYTAIVSKCVDTQSTHGTGCTLSAALAVYLARGLSVKESTLAAHTYVLSSISTTTPLGSGSGPLNHLHSITARPLPSPTKDHPYPFTSHLIQAVKDQGLWQRYTEHAFVKQLGAGKLDKRRMCYYLQQDYLYLTHYARAHALLAYKSSQFEEVASYSEIALHCARESKMHVKFCESFGISLQQLKETVEAPATTSYALYILDVGQRGGVLDLELAVASCCLGYGEVGLQLLAQAQTGENGVHLDGNPYKKWIEDYSGAEFQGAVKASMDRLEAHIASSPPTEQRLAELTKIWEECTRLEIAFWDGAMNLELEELGEAEGSSP